MATRVFRLLVALMLIVVAAAMTKRTAAAEEEITAPPSPAKTTLVVGKVSDNPKKHYQVIKPLADYVASHMADLGITEATVLLARDDQQMLSYLRQGKIDWVTETPFGAVYFHERGGAEYILKRWKKGVPDYYTVFIVRTDSGIRTIDDLRGKTIAFEDPGSSSAFFMPAATLIDLGLKLVKLDSPRETLPPEMVGYVFSHQEINSSTWLHKKMVDAVALSNLDWEKEDHVPAVFKKDFTIIHQATKFPRSVEMVRKDLEPSVKKRLKETLLAAHNDPEARAALKAYQLTTRFAEIDRETLTGLAEASRLRKIVQKELY